MSTGFLLIGSLQHGQRSGKYVIQMSWKGRFRRFRLRRPLCPRSLHCFRYRIRFRFNFAFGYECFPQVLIIGLLSAATWSLFITDIQIMGVENEVSEEMFVWQIFPCTFTFSWLFCWKKDIPVLNRWILWGVIWRPASIICEEWLWSGSSHSTCQS